MSRRCRPDLLQDLVAMTAFYRASVPGCRPQESQPCCIHASAPTQGLYQGSAGHSLTFVLALSGPVGIIVSGKGKCSSNGHYLCWEKHP